ncbi:MAG TPA: hypothetical protein ENN12_01265 [Epsilonproteobacteria bacterium]|nr:hypothetical protein [Campylobacterota bacterium]
MKVLYTILGIFIFFGGCTTKEQTALLKTMESKVPLFEAIGQTQHITVSEDEKVIGFITATYLHKKSLILEAKPEQFIIGIYTSNDLESWELLLDKKKPTSIVQLESNDKKLALLPLHNEWSDYYLVTFPNISKKQLTLQYVSRNLGKHSLKFSKVANYVNTKKGL